MADWLLLRLPGVPDEPASWLVVDARGTPVGPLESGPLAAAATRTAGRRVWVIVPGTDVLLAEPEVPVKAGLKLQQLVPYALEEDAVCVRAPGAAPVTLPADALAEALEIAQSRGADSPGGGRGLILYAGAAEWQRHSAQAEAARPRFDGVRIQLLTEGPLPVFAQQLPVATPINLLQGGYAPAAAGAAGLRAWRGAAILLLALLGLHVAGKVGELQWLKSRERQVDVSIRDAFHAAMPGEPSTLDARRRMEQRLAAARGA